MQVQQVNVDGWKSVTRFEDKGFEAFIAVHDTTLGKAIGGCRATRYASDTDALNDALKLSRAMTYKNSLAGLNFGGGKMVVNCDTVDLDCLKRIGDAVNHYSGTYYTGTDLGTSLEQMHRLKSYTKFVEDGKFGDTSIHTALGIYTCITELDLWMDQEKVNVWVQGVGKVGTELIRHLSQDAWFKIYVSDIDVSKVEQVKRMYDAEDYTPSTKVDIFCPCARGNFVTKTNFYQFKNSVICGGANNQLESDDLAKKLLEWGCWYCPDYLVNSGGVCAIAAEMESWDEEQLKEHIFNRAGVLRSLVGIVQNLGIDMLTTANMLAEKRIAYHA